MHIWNVLELCIEMYWNNVLELFIGMMCWNNVFKYIIPMYSNTLFLFYCEGMFSLVVL